MLILYSDNSMKKKFSSHENPQIPFSNFGFCLDALFEFLPLALITKIISLSS